MTTDTAPAAPKGQVEQTPPKQPSTGPPEAAPTAKPKDEKPREGSDQTAEAQNGAEQETATGGDAGQRSAGTAMMESLLARAGEIMAGEHALASASIAFQINNLAAGQEPGLQKTSVGSHTLARIRRTFVAPENVEDAWNVLAEQRLLVLHGSRGDGREHLATYLLDAFCDARVRRLRNGSLTDLRDADLTPGGGHLWEGPVTDAFDQLVAEDIRVRLDARQARMVVIWPEERDFPAMLSAYATRPGRLDLGEVIRRHLSEAAAHALLAEEAVRAARTGLTGAQQAVQFATLLEQVHAGRRTLEEALAEAEGPIRGSAEWFADLPEPEDRAFALALAALDGLSLPTVVAGARLADELIQRMEDPEDNFRLRAFHRPSRALLKAVEADCVDGTRETGYGRVPITAVWSRRDGYTREMLDALWDSFPYLQQVYLDWMDRLARDLDPYVRERVALAAGLLAAHDFDFIRGRLLLDWAAGDSPELRRAAATALRPPALNDDLREIVWSLLGQWAARGDDEKTRDRPMYRRRLTAAVALGGPVGDTDPERALDLITQQLLPQVVNATDYELWTFTAAAVTELFGDGGSSTTDIVLRRTAEWADDKETGPRNVAVAVLLGLATKRPDSAPGDERQLAPLLRATGRAPENVERTAALWRRALGHPQLAGASLRAVRILVQHVADAGDGDAELVELITAIPVSRRDRRTLRFHLRQWIEDNDDPHPLIADRLFEALSRGEDR